MTSNAKIAAAPISWGVCEVPGWGPMLPADRVLREMKTLELKALELGAPGFFPDDLTELKSVVTANNISLVGGFVPVVLHNPDVRAETLRDAARTAEKFAAAGVETFVSAVVVDANWAPRRPLETHEKKHLIDMFGEIDRITKAVGVRQVIHPHVGTLVETREDVQFVLDECATQWCLDTGHLAIGGYDPVEFASNYSDRVGHVHLKDVNNALAARQQSGELTLMQATMAGMFRSLGQGDVDIKGVLETLLSNNYTGWFVLEQDISIEGEPPAEGTGPVEDIAVSLAFLRNVLTSFANN